jgi:signal recognition particle receptor subunit beta
VHWKPSDSPPPTPVKVVIAGGFGVGKTTAVGAISEIAPLRTDSAMTSLAATVDSRAGVPDKTTTTVALDFGCITLDETLRLYLFGTPGQDRFGFMWDDIAVGALGALVIVDTRRLADSFPAVDYFEHIGLPYVVGINLFHNMSAPDLQQVRWALTIAEDIPVMTFDARDRYSVRDALLVVLRHTRARAINVVYRSAPG